MCAYDLLSLVKIMPNKQKTLHENKERRKTENHRGSSNSNDDQWLDDEKKMIDDWMKLTREEQKKNK